METGDEAPAGGARGADRESDAAAPSDADDTSDAGEGDGGAGESAPATGPTDRGGRREVVVPGSLFKIVTVFSTLLSVLFVVAGFGTLGAATQVVRNPPGSLVGQLLLLAGVPTATVVSARTTVGLGVGVVGLLLVAGGAAVYVYGSRFRAPGMGKPKDEADEGSRDG